MSNIDKRALREVAERATPGNWRRTSSLFNGITVTPFSLCGEEVTLAHTVEKRDAEFIAAANPATMLALLDELEHYKSREERVTKLVLDNSTSWDVIYKKLEAAEHTAAVDHEAACSLVEENEELKRKLEAAGKQLVELSGAASVNSQWKPDVCPVTGRKFFMWIEHETLGYVPTYGGPFDSYTIPTRDSSGEFSCERYDHDFGGWVGGEFIGLHLIDDEEQCRVCELEERIAELEARTVNLPKLSVGEVMHMSEFSRDYAEGWCAGNDNAIHEIRTAGIKVKES
ncbi:TPA: ead/Ea22-like family protein [Salmonella enterica]|nr:ead/Ea22-like family protein [Salmonella enterica subsp. enterica serovar Birkenhead]EHI2388779.1 ead/Ea22-like family protein [Salmonella enterica]EHI4725509.1 ead/Ea22-like family protein [Salmonella enterica]HCT1550817.1 ead/Ea22-like family protein [Salmonella enterica subsp. enterica serovar Birkenhead]HDN6006679.1 ead/Ea22-like family protein [Salmonella enterica subsp. enterica serovar Birkenhead]